MPRRARNFNLVVTPKFNPFTYDELAKPLVQATQEHKENENQFLTMLTEVNKLPLSQAEKDQYLAPYLQGMQRGMEGLRTDGLTPNTRNDLLEAKRGYASTYVPVAVAAEKRAKDIAQQAANPNLTYEKKAANTSIGEYLNNPNMTYRSFDGNKITQEVASQLGVITKQLRQELSGFTKKGAPDLYYKYYQKYGLTPEEVQWFMTHNTNEENINSNVFTGIAKKIMDNAVATTGVQNWDNPEMLDTAYKYAKKGLVFGLGEYKESMIADEAGKLSRQNNLATQRKTAAQKEKNANPVYNTISILKKGESDPYSRTNATANKAFLDKVVKMNDTEKAKFFGKKTRSTGQIVGYTAGNTIPIYAYEERYENAERLHKILKEAGFDTKTKYTANDYKELQSNIQKARSFWGNEEAYSNKAYAVTQVHPYLSEDKEDEVAREFYNNKVMPAASSNGDAVYVVEKGKNGMNNKRVNVDFHTSTLDGVLGYGKKTSNNIYIRFDPQTKKYVIGDKGGKRYIVIDPALVGKNELKQMSSSGNYSIDDFGKMAFSDIVEGVRIEKQNASTSDYPQDALVDPTF